MTIAKTIAIAEQHAARGDVAAACRILDGSIRAALQASGKRKLEEARASIVAGHAAAHRARQMNAELPAAQAEVLKLKGMI